MFGLKFCHFYRGCAAAAQVRGQGHENDRSYENDYILEQFTQEFVSAYRQLTIDIKWAF